MLVITVTRLAAPVPEKVIVSLPIPDPAEFVSFPVTVKMVPQGLDEGEIEFSASFVEFIDGAVFMR